MAFAAKKLDILIERRGSKRKKTKVHIELGGLSVVRVDPTRLDSKRDVPSVTPNVTTLIKEESHQN